MKKMFETRKQVEDFLINEFPRHDAERVLAAFSWAFFDGNYQPTDIKKVWEAGHKQKLKDDEREDNRRRLELEKIWHRNHPKTGGSDPADAILSDWVAMGFEDLDVDITFGISGVDPGEPSTAFGRVVQAALNWRGSSANWRRVAQNAYQLK